MKYLFLVATLLALGGCRLAYYTTTYYEDRTEQKVLAGSLFTDPKLENMKYEQKGPTTRSLEIKGYESKSNAEVATELLKAIH